LLSLRQATGTWSTDIQNYIFWMSDNERDNTLQDQVAEIEVLKRMVLAMTTGEHAALSD